MLGAIAGDVIGSVHEGTGTKVKEFPLFTADSTFTDDSVLTVAVADCLVNGGDYTGCFHRYFHAYPDAGFGLGFARWAMTGAREPYNSFGNGSAMRVSPVGYAFNTLEETIEEARRSAAVSHDHPEGIRGAQAVAAAVFLARTGHDKPLIRAELEQRFGYDLRRRLSEIRPRYRFDVSCQGSVPESIIAFLEGEDYEDAVRNAISLGGDADTMACIAGAIAEAYYGGVPAAVADETRERLDRPLCQVVERFESCYGTAL